MYIYIHISISIYLSLYIGMRGSPERGYFVPARVGSGRWADFESCSRIHACGTQFLKKCGFVQKDGSIKI